MTRWYVVCTHARSEHKAAWHLRNQGYRAYLPCYKKRRRHARIVDYVSAPLFPRYLFVEMDIARDRWRSVSSTIGVTHLVSGPERPTPLPEGVVGKIRAQEGEDGLICLSRENPFNKGDVIRITTGALRDQVGLFDCASDADRVVLLLDLLGRQVKVKLPLETVTSYP